jgi:ATP-dependent Clp protease adaptor protein ClpS
MIDTLTDIQVDDEVATDEVGLHDSCLVLHNDDINTFDWVIRALVDVCRHSHEQAEQCSIFIHYKGKYAVKHGSLERLRPMRAAISERGIHATIE